MLIKLTNLFQMETQDNILNNKLTFDYFFKKQTNKKLNYDTDSVTN